jgi:GT2 family glycosyltransferase
MNAKINCLIVTFNRLPLLRECVAAVQAQTYPINKIIVIDNASTDGTKEYLDGLPPDRFLSARLAKNTGGAGGFNAGLKESYRTGADWTWCMDDDTVPSPDALEKLAGSSAGGGEFGFLCSVVLFTDGTPHRMNNCEPKNTDAYRYNHFLNRDILLLQGASFVSCLIRHDAIQKCGFPISDFFIWADDAEYTNRIIKSGFLGGVVTTSFVVHKTKTNYTSSLETADPGIFQRFYYGRRNAVYVLKKCYGLPEFCLRYLYYLFMNCRGCLRRKDHRIRLLLIVIRAIAAGLFFNPRVETVDSPPPPPPGAPAGKRGWRRGPGR